MDIAPSSDDYFWVRRRRRQASRHTQLQELCLGIPEQNRRSKRGVFIQSTQWQSTQRGSGPGFLVRIRRTQLESLHQPLRCIIVLDVEDPSKPETWTFQLMSSWPRDANDDGQARLSNDALLSVVKSKTSIFADPIKSANEWVPEGTHVHMNRISYWQPIPWDNRKGSVTLAGDGAHPMTFRKLD